MNILIVEDEKRLADVLVQIMREAKYNAEAVYDGQDGIDYALGGDYDVIILDVMLPKKDGFAVVRALREAKRATPVLMLTARSEVSDRVAGLDCGADDYLTKPFASEELLARIRALSRRQGEVVLDLLRFGDLELSVESHDLKCGTRTVRLSLKEFEVLRILMANPHAIVTKETLIVKVWGYDSDAEANNVEAYISFLRKKLHYLNSRVSINAIRKVGYRLEEGKPC